MLAATGTLVAAFWAALHPGTLLLAAVSFLFVVDFLKSRRPKNYPPGPWRLPFVGNLFQLDYNQYHLALQPFVSKYGNIFSLDFSNVPSVVITGLPLIKEVLNHMEQNFVNRPVTLIREHVFSKNGLIFSSGQTWKEQRRFTLMTLRNFGLGKKSLEQRIQEEAHYLVEAIREEDGQPFDPHFKINSAVSNIICTVTFGERFDYQDSQFQEMLRLLDEAMCLESSLRCRLYNLFPWIMEYLPGPHQKVFKNWEKLKLFVSDKIDDHRKDWNPDETRDFIDAFLKEMTKYPDKTTTSFNEENLICSTLDLFFAGTETTSTTLRWALLFTALYPEVQEKVQAEIDRVIGQGRQPSLADRESMPYTNAVIHEVQRMGNIIPMNVPREVTVDTAMSGFHLPKGIMVLTNLTALHRDPKEWATPETFNPEHFLENGQFKRKESFLPFSIGKRACLGEQLARSELFIFITSLIQKFTFKPPVNEKLRVKSRAALTLSPVSYRICAVPRLVGVPAMLWAAGSLVSAFWASLRPGTLLLAAVTFLLLADFLKSQRPKNYPPGPRRLPFLGNLFQLDLKEPHLAVQQLVKKYGNVLSIDLGTRPSVVITGLPLIKEVFTNLDQNFLNRPDTFRREQAFSKNGIIFSNGQTWKEQRRFTLMTLRNFGLGKKSLEQRIQEEARYLVEAIREEDGQPFNPHFKINNAVSNIICSVTFGERFDYQDSQFQELLKLLDEAIGLEQSVLGQLNSTFPSVMKYIPGPHQTIFKNWEKLKLFISHVIDEHRKDWNPDEPRDFIDAFLMEMTKYPDKTTTSFNEENLICSTLDLFTAGTETTSTTLRWALLFMALYPEVQEKVQAEIDRVVGQGRQPSVADRESMPYSNAVVHEVQRMGNIIPMNVPRAVTVDTTLAGYHLPKGTMVMTNLTALHRDPKEWATPDTFNPEHFLENGQFKKRESFLPFSMGKRACVGEQLARSELFIFFTSLVQKFTFKPPANEKLSLKFRMSVTVAPVSHRICAVPRL